MTESEEIIIYGNVMHKIDAQGNIVHIPREQWDVFYKPTESKMTTPKEYKAILDEYRKRAYRLAGLPEDYKSVILTPQHLRENVSYSEQIAFLVELGKQHIHLLNRGIK